MDESRLAGRRIWCALPGPELGAGDVRGLADLAPGGVVLFERNLASAAQTRDLVSGIREVAGTAIPVAIDQEGGRVNRLGALDDAFKRLPPGREQAAWPAARLERTWALVGAALASLGIDVDFAPVADLDDSDGANAIGPRSFGVDAGAVVDCAGAVLRGLAAAGVAGCLKHFPGLGGTTVDTHEGLAESPVPEAELWERHARPFRELAAAAPLVMTAHAHYPLLDGLDPLPATFSRRLVEGWLRERCGFEGVVVSDDLEMGALARWRSPGERAVRALDAGVDALLFCKSLDAPRRARDDVAARLARGTLDASRVQESERRAGRLDAARRPAAGSPAPSGPHFASVCRELGESLA